MFRAVDSIKQRKTRTETIDRMSISPDAAMPFTCCAYATDDRARNVRGKE